MSSNGYASRGRGRGRGMNPMNTSNSSRDYRNYDPSRDDRNRDDRNRGRDRDRYNDNSRPRWGSRPRSPTNNEYRGEGFDRMGNTNTVGSRGRGRGRGRGAGINVPAWMNDDRLKRQTQTENVTTSSTTRTSVGKHRDESTRKEEKKDGNEIPKSAEEINDEKELKQQQQKEEKELQNLAAQFDDADTNNDDTESDMLNMFETDEDEEERLARERREKRKKRLRQVQPSVELERETKKQNVEVFQQERIQENNPKEEAVGNGAVRSDEKKAHTEISEIAPKIKASGTIGTGNVDGGDSFDIFSSNVSPPTKPQKTTVTAASGTGLDDAEGYYRATIGEFVSFTSNIHSGEDSISCSFRVQGIIGKGVFSTVLKCARVANNKSVQSRVGQEDVVAIKLIRSNETMAKAAQKEVRILRLLNPGHNQVNGSTKSSKEKHIVKMYELDEWNENTKQQALNSQHDENRHNSILLEYRNHTAIIFEHLPFNLRETLSKFGKNVGINLSAIRSYGKQLLTALQHLASHRVVHADIKLDNILVNENFSKVKLCDFGSAFFETDSDLTMTPYLVSRFYRAPEIMLGLSYDGKIDLWSVAVSLAELFTGSVLFPGRTNNDMMKRFMESKGPFSNKMVRRHVAGFSHLGLQPHFESTVPGGSNYNFRQQDFDKVTGKPVIRMVGAGNMVVPNKQIVQILLRSRSATDSRGDVQKFGEFLFKCLALDPVKRMSVDDALSHEFFAAKKTISGDAISEK
jgi:serine/threonine-protein kinase PRP4